MKTSIQKKRKQKDNIIQPQTEENNFGFAPFGIKQTGSTSKSSSLERMQAKLEHARHSRFNFAEISLFPPEYNTNSPNSLQAKRMNSQSIIQMKYRDARVKKRTTIYGGKDKPDINKKLTHIRSGWWRNLQVDPSQSNSFQDKSNTSRGFVRARTGKDKKYSNEGWVKWDHITLADDSNAKPELEHKPGDKYFGLMEPTDNIDTNLFEGSSGRKKYALEFYIAVRFKRNPVVKEQYSKIIELSNDEKRRKIYDNAFAMGERIYKERNFDRGIPVSNIDLINHMDDYLHSEEKMRKLNKQDQKIMQSIKNDPHWQKRKWFAGSPPELVNKGTRNRSKLALRATIKTGSQVHFLLDGLDMEIAVNPKKSPMLYNSFTYKELRHLYRYWATDNDYRKRVTFWKNNQPTVPPWVENPGLWNDTK